MMVYSWTSLQILLSLVRFAGTKLVRRSDKWMDRLNACITTSSAYDPTTTVDRDGTSLATKDHNRPQRVT